MRRNYSPWWTTAVLSLGTALGVAACSGAPASNASSSSTQPSSAPSANAQPAASANPLGPLAALAVERIRTGDAVSAAKFGSPQPIDDPAREQQELKAVAAQSPGLGINPAESTQFFRDQIEASKVVQRGLYQRWTAQPALRPADKPDLTKTVRPELDKLTTEILHQLQVTNAVRHAGAQCVTQAAQAFDSAAAPLDQLHKNALTTAWHSVCAPG
jgi:chorismate mutase